MSKLFRPTVVGIIHRSEGLPELKPALERERKRIEQKLSRLPKNVVVGVELVPKTLDRLRKGFQSKEPELFEYAALAAMANGLRVVPLEQTARHYRANTIVDQVKKLALSGKSNAAIDPEILRLSRKLVVNGWLRSVSMGEAILKQGCRVSFVGESHARHLQASPEHFEFENTPEKHLEMHPESHDLGIFSLPKYRGMKERLERIMVARLAVGKKSK